MKDPSGQVNLDRTELWNRCRPRVAFRVPVRVGTPTRHEDAPQEADPPGGRSAASRPSPAGLRRRGLRAVRCYRFWIRGTSSTEWASGLGPKEKESS